MARRVRASRKTPAACLLLVLATQAGCRPGAPGLTRLLDGLGTMVAIAVAVTVALVLVGIGLAIAAFSNTMGALAESRVPSDPESLGDDDAFTDADDVGDRRGAAALRAWAWAASLLVLYAASLAFFSDGRYHHGNLPFVLAGIVPLSFFLLVSVNAFRKGHRWPLLLALLPPLAWAPIVVESWAARELSELPGRIVQLAYGGSVACARLSTGQVSCLGNGTAGHGDDRRTDGPTLVRDLEDALDVQLGDDIACALRHGGPPVCWGRGDELPIPHGDGFSPWELTQAQGAVQIIPGRHQIVWRMPNGELGGWPKPLPAGLPHAEHLVGATGYFRAWFCAIGTQAPIRCWEAEADETVALDVSVPDRVAMRAHGDLCGVWDGVVRCYDLRDPQPPWEPGLEGVEQLIALEGFCARDLGGRVWCWRGSREPEVLLEGAEDIFGADAVVCAANQRGRTCAPLDQTGSYYVKGLLNSDRE